MYSIYWQYYIFYAIIQSVPKVKIACKAIFRYPAVPGEFIGEITVSNLTFVSASDQEVDAEALAAFGHQIERRILINPIRHEFSSIPESSLFALPMPDLEKLAEKAEWVGKRRRDRARVFAARR